MAESLKVLIIEDEEILADNLRTHLERCGCDVSIAGTGRTAIAAACAFQPQLILLDYHLPDMDGFSALDAIHATDIHCDCILMTGHPTDTVVAGARRHGIDHILFKPFPFADLTRSLHFAS